ncbi:MAG: hypothetical protein AAF684_03740 [Pseudomonadota bacterium]
MLAAISGEITMTPGSVSANQSYMSAAAIVARPPQDVRSDDEDRRRRVMAEALARRFAG